MMIGTIGTLVSLSCGIFPLGPSGADWHDDLAALVHSENGEFQVQRDRLLRVHPELWDVEAAAKHSWEAGLSASILNARLEDPDLFSEADAWRPIQTRKTGHFRYFREFELKGDSGQWFLIEKILHPEPWEGRRNRALDILVFQYGTGRQSPGSLALWLNTWENSELDVLRVLAIHAVASFQDDRSRNLLRSVLADREQPTRIKKAVLTGLRVHPPAFTTQLLVRSFSALEYDFDLARDAGSVLGAQANEGARIFLRRTAANPANNDTLRIAALTGLGQHPTDGDLAAVLVTLDANNSDKLCYWAARWASQYPIEDTRGALFRLYEDPDRPEAAKRAMFTITQVGTDDDIERAQRIAESGVLDEQFARLALTAIDSTIRRRAHLREVAP